MPSKVRLPISRAASTNLQQTFFTAGTARDVSYLIDFLPSFLYPNDERTIVEWGVGGISLGGHSTWIALRQGNSTSSGYSY